MIPKKGIIIAPWYSLDRNIRKLNFWEDMNPNEPCIKYGENVIGMDLQEPVLQGFSKIGIKSSRTWVAHVNNDYILKSKIIGSKPESYEYPEGDSNITMFTNEHNNNDIAFGEMEHVGPLTYLEPNKATYLTQKLELIPNNLELNQPIESWLKLLDVKDIQRIIL